MSENIPYNEEQWDDLPLPNKEEAWQKMELLLDKEEKRRRILPFWIWPYGLLGLLLIGLAAGGYLLLHKNDSTKQSGKTEQREIPQHTIKQQKSVERKTELGKATQQNLVVIKEATVKNSTTTTTAISNAEKTVQQTAIAPGKTPVKNKSSRLVQPLPSSRKTRMPLTKRDSNTGIPGSKVQSLLTGNDKGKPADTGKKNDTLSKITPKASQDSTTKKDTAKTLTSPPVVSNDSKREKVKKKNRLTWSAGVGLQQAIAFNGQQASSYNLSGEQNALADHLPSVYVRLQKGKGFLQGEIHYKVPEPVEAFSFSQATTYNVLNTTLTTEQFFIQKLYYHHLPFSVNYFILQNLSVGVGGTYNLLAGAVTEQETKSRNVLTGTETLTKTIEPVKGYKDSFLYKSTAGLLLQSDYHWKRLSVGLRYTKNLQPFIKYTKPDGAVLNEKNEMLQAIIRFRLF